LGTDVRDPGAAAMRVSLATATTTTSSGEQILGCFFPLAAAPHSTSADCHRRIFF
jgi:hypothetical protein